MPFSKSEGTRKPAPVRKEESGERKAPPDRFDFTLEPRQLRARVLALEALVLALHAHLDLLSPELGAFAREIADKRAEPKAIRRSGRAAALALQKRRREKTRSTSGGSSWQEALTRMTGLGDNSHPIAPKRPTKG